MPSFVVIKVKYGDTLRRFNVAVNGEQRFVDLNMEGLRQKICSLFGLSSTANITLTYRDEDNDIVTLANDEDLHDVVRQGLNPVRITVDLKTDKTAPASVPSSPSGESSSNSQQNLNSSVSVLLNSVSQNSVPEPLRSAFLKMSSDSEPLRSALLKISSDLKSKAEPSTLVADFMDVLSKLGQTYQNASHTASYTDFGSTNVSGSAGGSDSPKQEAPNVKLGPSADEGIQIDIIQVPSSVSQSSSGTKATRKAEPERPANGTQATREAELGRPANGTQATKEADPERPANGTQASREAEPGRPSPSSYSHKGKNVYSGPCSDKISDTKSTKKNKDAVEASAGKYKSSEQSKVKHVSSKKETSDNSFQFGGSFPKANFPVKVACKIPPFGWPNFPGQLGFGEGPMGSVFHKGVRCDGCGVLPITGPRFKSRVKHDYDLCSICFGRMGNDADYYRIDIPLNNRDSWDFNGFHNQAFNAFAPSVPRVPPVPVPVPVPGPGPAPIPSILKRPSSKRRLDSRFIMDVNVLDGTVMAPLTSFTKIWRMRNNGATRWQRGLQLLWIGGDRFSSSDVVEIELPSEGVNPGKEVDIAVDFVAPELPGQYVSYWRMAESSGQKFGQRVWALIQVDSSVDLTDQSSPQLNLNMPPESNETSAPEVPDNDEPAQNVEAENSKSPSKTEQIEDLNFPINNDLLIASDSVGPASAAVSSFAMCSTGADNAGDEASSPLSNPDVTADGKLELPSAPPANLYPIINISDLSSASCSTARNSESDLAQDHGKSNVEETLLKELEDMGFKEIDLNKKVLRVNDYDLERSVDDLCGVSEWDPMLQELREMGFEDKVTNKRLLAKNNGSITRVVMDLIAGEKEE